MITAAHCVKEFEIKFGVSAAKFTRFVPGLHIARLPPIFESFSEWNTTVHEVHHIYRINDYDFPTLNHDFAIAIMKTPFIFNEKIKPIKLDFRPTFANKLTGCLRICKI